MAIYHLSVKTVSRSAGRSATAAAAYRAGVEITDERTGEIHDYTRKGGVESAELVLPAGAPEWAADRAALWNAAEQAETRKNSTVAREFEIALPEELSPAERQRLARDLAREIVERHGCVADVAIHAPGKEGDNRNHHAHILLSTRRLGPEGFTEKTRELDDQKTGPQIVTQWRERFASLQNERLREAGIDARVDHRTLEAQGIDREPTRHLGPAATGYERRTDEPSRKRLDFEAEVADRLARAKALGELERQGKALDRGIIDLSGDMQAALRERDQLQAELGKQQAREAFERQKAEQERQKQAEQAPQRPQAERPARDPLAGFRAVIERAEADGGLALDVSKAQLAVAQEFQAAGKYPLHHLEAIMQEGQARAFASLQKQFQAERESQPLESDQKRPLEAAQSHEKRHPLQKEGETLDQTGWRLRAAFIKAERDAWREDKAAREREEGAAHAARMAELQQKRPWFGREKWAQEVAEAARLARLCERRAQEALRGEEDHYGDSQWTKAADRRLDREYPELREAMTKAAAREEAERRAQARERQAAQKDRQQGQHRGPRR